MEKKTLAIKDEPAWHRDEQNAQATTADADAAAVAVAAAAPQPPPRFGAPKSNPAPNGGFAAPKPRDVLLFGRTRPQHHFDLETPLAAAARDIVAHLEPRPLRFWEGGLVKPPRPVGGSGAVPERRSRHQKTNKKHKNIFRKS